MNDATLRNPAIQNCLELQRIATNLLSTGDEQVMLKQKILKFSKNESLLPMHKLEKQILHEVLTGDVNSSNLSSTFTFVNYADAENVCSFKTSRQLFLHTVIDETHVALPC